MIVTKKVQVILCWIFSIGLVLSSAQFFFLQAYAFGILFFLLGCTINPFFLHLVEEKNIHAAIPVTTVFFLFIVFTAPSYLVGTPTAAVVLDQTPTPAALEKKPEQATYVIQEIKDAKTVVHKAEPVVEEKPVYIPKKEQKVKITQDAFVPQNITIERGTTVIWTNTDERLQIIHIVNTTGGYTSIARSGRLAEGDSFSLRFDSLGEFPYRGLLLTNPHGHITVVQ